MTQRCTRSPRRIPTSLGALFFVLTLALPRARAEPDGFHRPDKSGDGLIIGAGLSVIEGTSLRTVSSSTYYGYDSSTLQLG